MKTKYLATIFTLILLVCLPAIQAQNTAQNNSQATTLSPLIEVELPAFYNQPRIDIVGTSETNADIRLFVNNELIRTDIVDDTEFHFYSVPLKTDGNNIIRIDAYLGSKFNSKTFDVFVDLIPPTIQLTQALPAAYNSSLLTITGTVSEIANVTIVLGNDTLFQQQTDSFNQNLALNEGPNYLKIIAQDSSGNQDVEEQTIEVDTQPPILSEVKPLEDAAFYYEGRVVGDIVGKSEPGAKVYMFVSPPFFTAQEPTGITTQKVINYDQYSTHVNADGTFKFDDVDFEHPRPVEETLGPRQVSPSQTSTTSQLQTDEKTAHVYLVVVDKAGLTSQQMYTVAIGSCFSGSLDFTVSPVPAYQTPSLLSPERLDSGIEIVSFVLSLSYRGQAATNRLNASDSKADDYWEITGLIIEPACRRDLFLERDPSYQYACQILPNQPNPPPQPINIEYTNWYFRYNLGATSQFTNFSTDFWETLNNNELKFPFKITVQYNEKLPGKNIEQKSQSVCREVAYFVDVPIDPRKVLPDHLLESSQKNINKTIETIDKVIEPLDKIIRYVGLFCLGGTATRALLQIYRRFSESTAFVMCQAEQLETQNKKECYIKNKKILEECYYVGDEKDKPIPDEALGKVKLICPIEIGSEDPGAYNVNQPINLEKSANAHHFSSVASTWKTEADLYEVYRYICDRVYCHSAPAKWTQEKTVSQIRQAKYAERGCSPDASTARFLTPIDNCYEVIGEKQKVLKDHIKDRHGIVENRCYALGNAIYAVKPISKQDPNSEYTKLERIDNRFDKDKSPAEIIAIKKGNTYYTANSRDCKDVCQTGQGGKDVWQSECQVPDPNVKSSEWYHYGPTQDCWEKDPRGTYECYCKKSEEKAWEQESAKYKTWVAGSETGKFADSKAPGADLELKGEWPWSYRQWQIYRTSNGQRGVYYPTERYYSDRDMPAAFGMNYLLDYVFPPPKTTEINPFTQHIGAIQTVCLTGIRQRLIMLRSILVGVNNCLHQIETTGQADAGVCKELFTQYICNLVYQVFTLFQDECTPTSFDDAKKGREESDSIIGFFKRGSGALTDTMDDMSQEISEDYGNANLNNLLEGGSQALMKKVCMAAFGYDVGFDVDSFIDAAYSVPFKTSAAVFSNVGPKGRREFLGFDPTTAQALYEYRTAWTIFPGCDLESYSIDLVAVTENEKRNYNLDCSAVNNFEPGSGGCDNLRGSAERKRPFASGGSVSQGNYIDKDNSQVFPDFYRYDHVKITLNLAPEWDAEKCFPTENREGNQGVFYFPIYDATAKDIVQCAVSIVDGKFICAAPGLEGMGKTWIEDVECEDPENGQWKDCNKVTYAAKKTNDKYDRIKVKANIYSSGEKQCLRAYVQTSYSGKVPETDVWWEIIGLGQPRTVPIEMLLVNEIDDSLFRGKSRYQIAPANALDLVVVNYPSQPITPFEIYFGVESSMFRNKAGKLVHTSATHYQVKPAQTQAGKVGVHTPTVWKEIPANGIIKDPSNKFSFNVTQVNLNYSKTEDEKHYYYTPVITINLATTTYSEQTWSINLELYHPDTTGLCNTQAVTKVRIPSGLAFRPEKIVQIKVKETRVSTAEKDAFNKGLSLFDENKFLEAAAEFKKAFDFHTGSDIEILSYYLFTYSKIKQGAKLNDVDHFKKDIENNLEVFNSRRFIYSSELKDKPEYHLVAVYLNEIYKKLYPDKSITIPTQPTSAACGTVYQDCKAIDEIWQKITDLQNFKRPVDKKFYNPKTSKWQKDSVYLLATATAPTTTVQAKVDVEGDWITARQTSANLPQKYDTGVYMTLNQNGIDITGTFKDGGTIQAKLDDHKLTGVWSKAGQSGTLNLNFAENNNSFGNKWTGPGAPTGGFDWIGAKTQGNWDVDDIGLESRLKFKIVSFNRNAPTVNIKYLSGGISSNQIKGLPWFNNAIKISIGDKWQTTTYGDVEIIDLLPDVMGLIKIKKLNDNQIISINSGNLISKIE